MRPTISSDAHPPNLAKVCRGSNATESDLLAYVWITLGSEYQQLRAKR